MNEGTNFLNWNWAAQHVQVELQNGEYISAESALVLAGPSRLEYIMGANTGTIESAKSSLYPIGLIQNFMMAQNRFLTRLFEIGSKRAYFVTGRLAANFQLNRIKFFGPSLMRMLYALAPATLNGAPRPGFGGNPFVFEVEGTTAKTPNLVTPAAYEALFPKRFLLYPGHGGAAGEDNRDFFINLASDLFQIPFGMAVIFKDAKNRPYGAVYLQDCFIEAHSMGVDANNVVIAEGVNGQFDMVAPVQLVSAA